MHMEQDEWVEGEGGEHMAGGGEGGQQEAVCKLLLAHFLYPTSHTHPTVPSTHLRLRQPAAGQWPLHLLLLGLLCRLQQVAVPLLEVIPRQQAVRQ